MEEKRVLHSPTYTLAPPTWLGHRTQRGNEGVKPRLFDTVLITEVGRIVADFIV